jgi:hypothetical protein
VDVLVTDAGATEEMVAKFTGPGVRVIRV